MKTPPIKRAIILSLLAGILLSFVATIVFKDRIAAHITVFVVRKALPEADITLQSARLSRNRLRILNLHGKHTQASFQINELDVFFTLRGLLRGEADMARIKTSLIRIHGPADGLLPHFPPQGDTGSIGQSPRLTRLEVSDMTLDIQSGGLTLAGTLSFSADLRSGRLLSLGAHLDSAKIQDFSLKTAHLAFDQKTGGELSVERVDYQRLSIRNIAGPLLIGDGTLSAAPLTASALGGSLRGRFEMVFGGDITYELDVELDKLSLPDLMSDLKLDAKLLMTGLFSGNLTIHGNASGITSAQGFLNDSGGGNLIIQDESFMQTIADKTGQSLALVENGLKEYHYDTGRVELANDDRNLSLDMELNGPNGKRRLNTVFHDVI